MGNILQIRLLCATPDLEKARARWPRLCELARELHRRNAVLDGGQALFLPRWNEEQPMPGVRELAQTLQQLALIFPDSFRRLPGKTLEELSRDTDALGDALGRWNAAEAGAALDGLTRALDVLEAALAETPPPATSAPAPAVVKVRAVTWNPALLDELCPSLCAALRDADKESSPDTTPPPPDTTRLLDFLERAPFPPEIRERLAAPLERARACRLALEKACRDGDPRAADRNSNDMDDILERLEEAVGYRPTRRKGFFRRLFG